MGVYDFVDYNWAYIFNSNFDDAILNWLVNGETM